jgi:hypothetical protein
MKRLLAIKKENVGLEKQVNKLNKVLVLNKSIKLLLTIIFFGSISQIAAQDRIPFDQGKKYILADVEVTGKISFNKQGSVVEVSDIGFKTVQQFSDIFCFSTPVARVNNLQLLELKYVLDKEIFFLEPQPQNPCVVQLDLQFQPAFNGADESIEIIFNILTSFLTNNLNI